MSQLGLILKPILVTMLPAYIAISVMLGSMVATLEIVVYIALYYPHNAISALSLVFFLFQSMFLYDVISIRSDKRNVWKNTRVPIPPHWRMTILDVIKWVRSSKLVQMALFYAGLGIFMVITWATIDVLKVMEASILVDLMVALLWSFVGIFLFTTGLVLYRSALAPVDTIQADSIDAIVDALPKIGPKGVEYLSRDRSAFHSSRIMRLLIGFMGLSCIGSAITSVAPFVGYPSLAVPGLYLSGISMILVIVMALAPFMSRKKSSLLRALDTQRGTE